MEMTLKCLLNHFHRLWIKDKSISSFYRHNRMYRKSCKSRISNHKNNANSIKSIYKKNCSDKWRIILNESFLNKILNISCLSTIHGNAHLAKNDECGGGGCRNSTVYTCNLNTIFIWKRKMLERTERMHDLHFGDFISDLSMI